MSILDMDVTDRRDPEYVRSREFARVRRGYDPDQVRGFLDRVAIWLEDANEELEMARRGIPEPLVPREAPAPSPRAEDPFAALGDRVAELLRSAEHHADQVQREADQKAQRLMAECNEEVARIRQEARSEAETARREA